MKSSLYSFYLPFKFKQMNKVQIIPDEKGNVIRQSQNPEYGYVRLSQNKEVYSNNFLSIKPVTALLHAKLEDFKVVDMKNKTELPGRIVIKESTTPFNIDDPDSDLKIAGKTGIVCCYYGEPIYRKTMYDATGTMEDEFIAHTNGDAIKEANAQGQQSALNNLFNIGKDKSVDNQIDLEDTIREIEAENESKEEAPEVSEEITAEDTPEEISEEISEEVSEEVIDDYEEESFEL